MSFLGIFGGSECVDLGLLSFGCSVEQATRSRNKLENSLTTNVSTSARSSIEQTAVVNAVIDITNGPTGRIECKTADFKNKVTGNVQFVANSNQQVVTTVQETLNQAIDNAVKSLNQQQTEYLSKAANGKSVTEVVNEMKTAINTNLNTNVINEIRQNVQVGSSIKFRNDGLIVGDTCNFDNDVALNLFSSAVIAQAVQSTLQLEDIQNIINYVENDVKIQNQGLSGLLKSLTVPLIILGVVLLLGFIIWLYFTIRGPKQQALQAAANTFIPYPSFSQPAAAAAFNTFTSPYQFQSYQSPYNNYNPYNNPYTQAPIQTLAQPQTQLPQAPTVAVSSVPTSTTTLPSGSVSASASLPTVSASAPVTTR